MGFNEHCCYHHGRYPLGDRKYVFMFHIQGVEMSDLTQPRGKLKAYDSSGLTGQNEEH
jgi:hypothetical protein